MKFYYLGTCSGTEPMPNMHHASIVFEIGGILYWFDAGESCSYNAYVSGMDMSRVKAIFVSHPHYDHTEGLPSLLATLRKIYARYKKTLVADNTLTVYFPDKALLEAIKTVATSGWRGDFPFTLIERDISDGVIFEDENVKVSAVHNRHMREDGSDGWHSFSFLIEAEGKRVVYSGDVASPDELDPFLSSGCDYLIHETGHHAPSDVTDYAISRGVRALRFSHHGRTIINDRPAVEKIISDAAASANISIKLAYDGMIEEL